MRTLLLAFVLSLFTPSTGHAALIPMDSEFVPSEQNAAIDRMICDKVRYNLGIPKADCLADLFMADCLGKMSLLTDRRPVFYWQESAEEAQKLCTAYTKQDRFDPDSDMLLINDTIDFDECMKGELWH
jgi:hypothetical protein